MHRVFKGARLFLLFAIVAMQPLDAPGAEALAENEPACRATNDCPLPEAYVVGGPDDPLVKGERLYAVAGECAMGETAKLITQRETAVAIARVAKSLCRKEIDAYTVHVEIMTATLAPGDRGTGAGKEIIANTLEELTRQLEVLVMTRRADFEKAYPRITPPWR